MRTVLAITPFEEDIAALRKIFTPGWKLRSACSLTEAWLAVHAWKPQAIVTESCFPDGLRWKDLAEELVGMENPPVLLVASREPADAGLQAEVAGVAKACLLNRPFDPAAVLGAVSRTSCSAQEAAA